MDKDDSMIKDVCQILKDRFDSVQVFVTRHDDDSGTTLSLTSGAGNYMARIGQVSKWVMDVESRDEDKQEREGEDLE